MAGTVTSEFRSPAEIIAMGLQASDLELEHFGFDPSGFFFFTGNTSYLNNGEDEVQIIAAALNPAGATSLEGVVTHRVTFTIDGYGNVANVTGLDIIGSSAPIFNATTAQSPVPEPSFAPIFAVGIPLAIVWLICARIGRRRQQMQIFR